MTNDDRLKLRFAGSLVEQLGAKMYPSATATVAEMISNAWDADARRVWVTIPFGKPWDENDKIVILDDGHGMTRAQAQEHYLTAGRKRRLHDNGESLGGRKVQGRKGLGKFAAFGTAKLLDCYTMHDGGITSFRLDYDSIRRSEPGAETLLEENCDREPLMTPDGTPLPQGTRITLSRLDLNRAIPKNRFMKSMTRRFAISETEMSVLINGERLERFNMDLAIRLPNKDHIPGETLRIDEEGWGIDLLSDGEEVRWWIGFTDKPIDEDYLLGISILGNKKMIQRPFLFETAGGLNNQLGLQYIVGEVFADWLDQGADVEDDLLQTNKDQLQLEDERVKTLLEWGRSRLRWALRQRAVEKKEKVEKVLVSPDIENLLGEFTATEKNILRDIARTASGLHDPDEAGISNFMAEVVNAYKDKAVRELIERVQYEAPTFQSSFWPLVREFSLIDARRNLSIIQARLETIERLKVAVQTGATEVPELHNIVKEYPWLLDPRWSLMGDEVNPTSLGIDYKPTPHPGTGERMDFLFALQPKAPADLDELLIVEIKRATHRDGQPHRVSRDEVHKLHDYVVGVSQHLKETRTNPPRITGLMIADRYTREAVGTKNSYEDLTDPKFEFKTWSDVITNTERLHTSWLEVTRKATSRQSANE